MLKLALSLLAATLAGYVFIWCMVRATARRENRWTELSESARRLGVRDRGRTRITQGGGDAKSANHNLRAL